MFFLNPWLLVGLAGISIPLILHLYRKRKSSRVKWGAMIFLTASLERRRRQIMLEEILLLATRCLIVALAALAVARPYASGHRAVVAVAAFVAAVAAVALFASAVVIWGNRRARRQILVAAAAMAVFSAAIAATEGIRTAMRRFRVGSRDVAIVIDASSSMTVVDAEGSTAFSRAVEEVDAFIQASPRNTSFAIVLGATPSLPLTASPVSDRKLLFSLLDGAKPLEGTFNAPDTLAAAATVLANGAHGAKQIVVFGDGQAAGWDFGDIGQWSHVAEVLGRLPSKPRVIWRALGLPSGLRNATVSSLSFDRESIGTDRDVTITATVANNGEEAVSPSALTLSVEGRSYTDGSIGQLLPGEKRTLVFRHRFRSPGTRPVTATLEVADDLAYDNSLTRMAAVCREARILVVEGLPGRRLSDSPGAFAAIALSPTARTLEGIRETARGGKAAAAAADETAGRKAPGMAGAFFAPKLVTAADLPSIDRLSDYSAIILADVQRLGTNDAARIASFVENGGGLLAICAKRGASDFYNSWTTADGLPLLPLRLEGDEYAKTGGVPLDAQSVRHPALVKLVGNGDLASVVVERLRRTSLAGGGTARVEANLIDGSPFIASRKAGGGMVVQFASALDPSSGNFVSRQSFLPAMHAIAGHLVNPVSHTLNLQPAPSSSVLLSARPHGDAQDGATSMRGVFRRDGADGPLVTVFQPTAGNFSFDWRRSSIEPSLPPDTPIFCRWTGSIAVPASGKWRFSINCGGTATISFPSDSRYAGLRTSSINVELEAGRRHDIAIEWSGQNRNNAFINLLWQGPGRNGAVPMSALSPVSSSAGSLPESFPVSVEGPCGAVRAFLRIDGDSSSLRIPSRLASGIYTASVPSVFAPDFTDVAAVSNGFARISFSVANDPSESTIAPPGDDDVAFVSRFVDFTLASTPQEFDKAINGAKVGRELWRFAAFPLLLLLVAETFLTRWISRQRRLGEEDGIEFASAPQVSSRFTELLAQMKGGRR